MFGEAYNRINLPTRYASEKHETAAPKFGFGKAAAPATNMDLTRMYNHSGIEEMLGKSEWLWNQYKFKNREKQTEEEATYSVACLVRVVEMLIVRSGDQMTPEAKPNKRVIITKTGKVIELSDESDDKPVNSGNNEPTVIEHINNIETNLKDRKPENIEYVKNYIEDWVEMLMSNKFDKDTLLSLFDAEEVRNKTLQTIKKLNYDMVAL